MKYKGLCEQYGPAAVGVAALFLPVGIEAGLSHVFNFSANYGMAFAAGAWSYVATHFLGRKAAEYYLRDKGDRMGPRRASRIMQRIQAGIYAGIVAATLGYSALPDEGTKAPDMPTLPSSAEGTLRLRPIPHAPAPAPSRFLPS